MPSIAAGHWRQLLPQLPASNHSNEYELESKVVLWILSTRVKSKKGEGQMQPVLIIPYQILIYIFNKILCTLQQHVSLLFLLCECMCGYICFCVHNLCSKTIMIVVVFAGWSAFDIVLFYAIVKHVMYAHIQTHMNTLTHPPKEEEHTWLVACNHNEHVVSALQYDTL